MTYSIISLFENEELKIKKDNAIIQVSNHLTMQQRKLINVLIYVAKKILKSKPEQTIFNIDLATLRRFSWITAGDNQQLKKSLKQLVEYTVEFDLQKEDSTKHWGIFPFLAQVWIMEVQKWLTCVANFAFPPIILEAIKNPSLFAKLDVRIIRRLNSKYSISLYETLKSYYDRVEKYRKEQIRKIDINTLRDLLGVPNGAYKKFAMFRINALDKAVEEINKYTDLSVRYDLEKEKKITAVIFSFSKRKEKIDLQSIDIQMQQYGLSQEYITKIRKKKNNEYILSVLKYVDIEVKRKKIQNIGWYTRSALEEGYGQNDYEKRKRKEEEIRKEKEEKEVKFKKIESDRKRRKKEETIQLVEKWLSTKTEKEVVKLQEKYKQSINGLFWGKLLAIIEKKGFEVNSVRGGFYSFLSSNELDIPS